MYFIPRNNKIYHYIAHTSERKRYLFIGFFMIIMIIFTYCLQRLITVYSAIYTQELISLQKQYNDCGRIERKSKQLLLIIEEAKKNIQEHIFIGDVHEYFKKQLLFVLGTIKSNELQLNSYGVQKEKKHEWYKKEITHFDVTGSLKNIINFLEAIKNSKKMISIAQWSLVSVDKDRFHLHCDMEFVLIFPIEKAENKSLQL